MDPGVRVEQQSIAAEVGKDDRVIRLDRLHRLREIALGLMGRHIGDVERTVLHRLQQFVGAGMVGHAGKLVETLDVIRG
jgi:hypothetical protein